MKFELTPEEYRKLIELAYLGEWMVNAEHDPEFHDEAAGKVVQRLLAAGHLKQVDRDAETGNYLMATEWTDKLFEDYILDYDEHVFWDELAERLALRDLARELGVPEDSMERDEHLPELRRREARYRQEFDDHGLSRVEINSYLP